MRTWQCVVGACFVVTCISGIFAEERPNVIICVGDDHGWDEVGYHGHPHVKTPILDEMAATGLRLDRFYSAHPSCSPTRGSILTGRHPNRYGTFAPNFSIRPEEITVAHQLRQAGYRCGHFGKWHVGPVKSASPTNPGAMGFDSWVSHDNFFELDPTFSRDGGPPEKFQGESSEIVVAEAIKFLNRARQQNQPFFAFVCFGSPHEPYSGLEKDLALYDDLPAKYAKKQVRLTSNDTGRPTRRPLRDVLRERYAEITAMDRAIGQLRDWLKRHDLNRNTLLWYCGDNGTPGDGIVTSPLRGQKGNLYEGGIRVPGIIEWPARVSNPMQTTVNAVTSDMLPTICAVADVALPERLLDGLDLTPLFDGRWTERPKPIGFWSYQMSSDTDKEPYIEAELQRGTTPLVKMMGAIHTRNFRNFHQRSFSDDDLAGSRVWLDNDYKLVVHGNRGKETEVELFDLRTDRAETHDVSKSKPAVTSRMVSEQKTWQRSVLKSLSGAEYR